MSKATNKNISSASAKFTLLQLVEENNITMPYILVDKTEITDGEEFSFTVYTSTNIVLLAPSSKARVPVTVQTAIPASEEVSDLISPMASPFSSTTAILSVSL